MKAGRQSGEIGVDRYFEQQISLAAFADVAENALDDLPIIWASTPAREMGYTLAERVLQRISSDEGHSRNLTLFARLVTQK
ncbi:Maltose regulon regulatory protein MalI [compost metagenome]